jgi:hypothetical protein
MSLGKMFGTQRESLLRYHATVSLKSLPYNGFSGIRKAETV